MPTALPENTRNALPNQAAAASLPQNVLDSLPIGGVNPVAISSALPVGGVNPLNVTDALPTGAGLPDNTVDALPFAAAPVVQFSVPELTTVNPAINWVNELGSNVDIWNRINKTAVDDTTYIQHTLQGGTVIFRMTLFTNPGTFVGYIVRVRLRIVGALIGNEHALFTYESLSGGTSIVSSNNLPADAIDNNGFGGPWSPGGIPGITLTNSFVTYEWPINPTPAAGISFVTKQRMSLAYSGPLNAAKTIQCSMMHCQAPV
jgi:hypothetical protein